MSPRDRAEIIAGVILLVVIAALTVTVLTGWRPW